MKTVDAVGSEKQVAAAGGAVTAATQLATLTNLRPFIFSGNITNGTQSAAALSSGFIHSGHIASGALGGMGYWGAEIGSDIFPYSSFGTIGGAAPSDGIGPFEFGSGAIRSGHLNISGQVRTSLISSGATTTNAQYVAPLVSGIGFTVITGEAISGGHAVCVSQSGTLLNAMASISGRMPAIGVVFDNVASGRQATIYTHGAYQVGAITLTGFNFSGQLGKAVYVGRSGHITVASGQFQSGGFVFTADWIQRLGVVINSGGVLINVSPICWSGLAQTNLTFW
jgi:hypothetical protein